MTDTAEQAVEAERKKQVPQGWCYCVECECNYTRPVCPLGHGAIRKQTQDEEG